VLASDPVVDVGHYRKREDGADAKCGIDDAEKSALGVVEVWDSVLDTGRKAGSGDGAYMSARE
jgi:hypothetical protein